MSDFVIYLMYGVWFLLLYMVPLIFFYKKTSITQDMIDLTGLKLTSVFDVDQKIVKITNDFDGFLSLHPIIKRNNYAARILSRICDDARLGNRINPRAYISNYKELCDKFNVIFVNKYPQGRALRYF